MLSPLRNQFAIICAAEIAACGYFSNSGFNADKQVLFTKASLKLKTGVDFAPPNTQRHT